MKKYYDDAPTAEIDTGKNVFRYYNGAGRLQVQMPKWTDADGNEKNGKCVTINLDALRECPEALEKLQKILNDIA
jgi:hypothetical protein